MIIMGIDLGDAHTGISLCDFSQTLAYPLCTVNEKDENLLARKIVKITVDENVESIVLGYPRNMDGSTGDRARKVSKFKRILKKKIDMKIILWDERLTTVEAMKNFSSADIKSRDYKKKIDAASSCLILQNYLDFLKNSARQSQF